MPMGGGPYGKNKLHNAYKGAVCESCIRKCIIAEIKGTGPAPTAKTKPLHWEKIPNRIVNTTWWKQEQSKVRFERIVCATAHAR
jgi:hypothetical protein